MPTLCEIPLAHPRHSCSYSTKNSMVQCLTELWEHRHKVSGGHLACNKMFVGRVNFATAGVEGFFTPDGVMVGRIFLLTAERPADIVDGLQHLRVRRLYTPLFPCYARLHSLPPTPIHIVSWRGERLRLPGTKKKRW